MLKRYSGVPINEDTKRDLIESVPLPSEGTRLDSIHRGISLGILTIDQAIRLLAHYDYLQNFGEEIYPDTFRRAVGKFQQDNGLLSDGIFGRATATTLKEKALRDGLSLTSQSKPNIAN